MIPLLILTGRIVSLAFPTELGERLINVLQAAIYAVEGVR